MTGETSGARATRAPGSRGAVAAETAAVMPIFAGFLIALIWILSLVATQIRVVDAARETARAAARTESIEAAIDAGRKVAPEGAEFTVSNRGDDVVVSVRAKVAGPGGIFGVLPFATAHAMATSAREDR